jgi:hypothetical protein|tara:strand:- start:4 stop:906 length:903 start_codon:yes stop_codon:yes gene_type:complete
MAIADFIEPAIKDFATQATATYSAPINTDTFTGRKFVAGEDPLQTQAINLAQQGVGSYAPFLADAQAAQKLGAQQIGGAATTVGGLSALTGPQAYQPFMSPYQQQVIDTTLAEYDKQSQAGAQQIRDAAVGSGNFGGGREGAMLGQYQSDVLGDRAALQAQLLSQGFGQAQQAAQQNFSNVGNIANMQSNLANAYGQQAQNMYGLSNFQRQGMGQDVSALGSLGALRQGQEQARLTADQQAAQTGAYEPYGRLSQYGSALTGLAGGVAGGQYAEPQAASPFQTALSTALGIGGLYGKIFK